MDWTAEAIDRLRGLWAEGHSTAEIGRRMCISKNAVVGKAHRLHLSARPSPIRREAAGGARPPPALRRHAMPAQPPSRPPLARGEPRQPAPSQRPVQPYTSPAPPVAAPAMASVPLLVLRPFPRTARRNCCWPMGDPGSAEFRFCSGDAIAGKPYCPEHAAVAYVQPRDRRDDAA
jgi:GcrA cell cycle regulator